MGRLYQRGRIWWIQYYTQGQLLRETSRSSLKSAAAALLKKREGDIVDGRVPNIRATKTTFAELVGLYRQDLAVNERATELIRARAAIAHLAESFSGFLASQITTDRINAFILTRRSAGATNGTVNRELGTVRRMFRLAAQ